MPQVFKCASCSGPLEFNGGQSQKCGFCGSTVLVPPHLYTGNIDLGPSSNTPPQFNNLADLTENAMVFGEIKKLIAQGKKIEAIKLYREKFGSSLAAAKDVVEKMERGERVEFTSISLASASPGYSNISLDPKAVKVAGGYFVTFLIIGILALFILGAVFVGFFFTMSSGTITSSESPAMPFSQPADAQQAEDLELLKIGGEGTGVGKFKDNRVVAVDNLGNIYSTDYQGGRIQIFDANGTFQKQWSAPDTSLIFAIATDRMGNLFVLGNKGITKYEALSGTLKATLSERSLRDIDVSPDGKVIAVGRQGIIYLSNELKVTQTFKKAPSDASSTFGFSAVTSDASGTMYLLDRQSKDIIKFSADGKFLNRMPTEVLSPNDIALDPKGNIYVSDTSRLYAYSPDGKKLADAKTFQTFGITFNDAGELFVAARPYVIKQRPFVQ